MKLNIHDGTRPDKRLCDTCQHSSIMKGSQQSQEVVFCHYSGERRVMPWPVVECNDYQVIGFLTKWEAEKIGWVLEVKKGVVVGFKPPKKAYDNYE